MPEQSQLEKDIAAFRSRVIDGIEDVKNSADNIDAKLMHGNLLLRRLVGIGGVIHVIRHW
jgi:hypothetical protein